jgi:hypothetical protein
LLVGAVLAAMALATFVTPLLGAHRVLVEEKNRLLGEVGNRLRPILADLHQDVDSGKLRRMDNLSKAFASLEMERNLLEKVPTWPWEPQTVRGLIGALLLPVAVWLIQLVLQRVIGS